MDYNDDPLEIGFNSKYLLDTPQIEGDDAKFVLWTARRRRWFRTWAIRALYVPMPMRSDASVQLQMPSQIFPTKPLPERCAVVRLPTDFRCYAHLRLDAYARPAVLTGPNGAGKTNLLEAISFFAPGRPASCPDAGCDPKTTSRCVSERCAGEWHYIETAGGAVEVGTGFETGGTG